MIMHGSRPGHTDRVLLYPLATLCREFVLCDLDLLQGPNICRFRDRNDLSLPFFFPQAEYKFREKSYQALNTNEVIAQLFDKNGASLGIEFEQRDEIKQKFGGSTDMGNVSHVVPSIHPKFYIGTTASGHSKEFTVAAGSIHDHFEITWLVVV